MSSTNLRVLFLGASRAVGLLRQFQAAAAGLGAVLEMADAETSGDGHPVIVSGLARGISAPPYDDPGFGAFLADLVRGHGVDIVVPAVDAATMALSQASSAVEEAGALSVCSSFEVCEAMVDKRQADLVLRALGLPVPAPRGFPVVVKPRYGEGTRGVVKLNDAEEWALWSKRHKPGDFLVQRFLAGPEYSLDGYVDRTGRILGLVSRRRLAVLGGEVALTRTERSAAALAAAERLLGWGRWFGPVVVQVILDGASAYVIDANPRAGSGITCSIHAGLAVPEWILRERLGLPLPEGILQWREGIGMSRSTRDHFFEAAAEGR
ncbi:MAG: ATP-grasp domain-containing protein [Gemmatimonadetes bacterium]|nr:ATP-grasp domain-containing protein [Gemmatimonadota bacterium]